MITEEITSTKKHPIQRSNSAEDSLIGAVLILTAPLASVVDGVYRIVRKKIRWKGFLGALLKALALIPLMPLLLAALVLAIPFGMAWVCKATWLGYLVRRRWYPQGKYLLFVYSDSRMWKPYIETEILPRVGEKAVVMNWSERSEWNHKENSLAMQVFGHWGGAKRFNPVAITFLPWWKPVVFRFWYAFKQLQHGKDKALKALEAELFKLVERIGDHG